MTGTFPVFPFDQDYRWGRRGAGSQAVRKGAAADGEGRVGGVKARWRSTLDASKEEAMTAVDMYNQTRRGRRLEGFFVHIHIAWLYLFEAEYLRDQKSYHYRKPNGHYVRVDGEPRTWELTEFNKMEIPENSPVHQNLKLTIALRNKIEHRYEEATTIATSGYAQSLLINYEERLTQVFGDDQSLGSQLTLPIFLGSLTRNGASQLAARQEQVPKRTRDFIAQFEAGMNPSIIQDHRYDFRVSLIPKLGSKTDADLALSFVREDELAAEEKQALERLGRSGTVIVREQFRPVHNEDLMKPTPTAAEIQKKIPYRFNVTHLTRVWQKQGIRPPGDDDHPERTLQDFCVYDRPHRDYLYTNSFIDYVAELARTTDGFLELTGLDPQPKPNV